LSFVSPSDPETGAETKSHPLGPLMVDTGFASLASYQQLARDLAA
jgi:hypothetical protein